MYAFLMTIFVIISLFLGLIILIQQGKGDMGLGSIAGSTQMLFGGSGGQSFFEKTTWVLGAIFMLGSLGLSVLKSRELRKSRLEGVTLPQKQATLPATQPLTQQPEVENQAQESTEQTAE